MNQGLPTQKNRLDEDFSQSRRNSCAATRPVRGGYAADSRLRKHADYQRAYKAARKQSSPSMGWFLADRFSTPRTTNGCKPETTGPRVGLTVGKVLGKAHERNRIKRRMRELVRRLLHELPEGVDIILHPRRQVMTMDFVKLETEILRIFRHASTQIRAARTPRIANPTQPNAS